MTEHYQPAVDEQVPGNGFGWDRLGNMLRPSPPLDRSLSPYRLLLVLTGTVFISELIIMFVIEFVFNQSTEIQESVLEAVLDASVLTLIVFPVLYYFSFKPLLTYILEHRRTERALQEAYGLMQQTFASLADAVFVLHMPERRVMFCNRAATDIFAYEQQAFMGRTLAQLFLRQEMYNRFGQEAVRQLHQKGVYATELQMLDGNGRVLYADITVTEMQNDQGDVIAQVVVCRDVTSRRHAEQQLRLQTTALEAAANGVVISDIDGIIEWVNPAFTLMTGYQLSEVAGTSLTAIDQSINQPEIAAQFWKTVTAGNVWQGELQARRKNGTVYIEEQTVAPVFDGDGRISHLIAIKQDITRRKEWEDALQESEERYRSLIETSPDAIVLTDFQANIIFSNQQAVRLLGLDGPADLLGRSTIEMIHPDDQDRARINLTERLKGNQPMVVNEYRFMRRDGTEFPGEVNVSVVRDGEGQPMGLTAVARDITTRKQAEFQLARHNQELRLLNDLGQQVVASLNPEMIFQLVLEQVMPLLEAECSAVLIKQQEQWVPVAVGGDYTEKPVQPLGAAAQELIQNQVIASETAVLLSSFTTPHLQTQIAQICTCQPAAVIMAPLRVNNEIIGVVQASHSNPHHFDQQGLQLLYAAANWAAIAMTLANQHDEIRHRLQETATLAAINQSLNETLDLDSILQLIADSVPRLIANVKRVVIHMLQPKENLLYPVIWSGQSEADHATLYLNANEGVMGQALHTGSLINIPDVQQIEDNPMLPSDLHSLMVAPLQSGRQQLGTISVHNSQIGAFGPDHERLLTRLADSAAITIATANLYQAERTQRQLAESLAAAAKALNLSLKLEDVLEMILRQTLRIVRCDHASIYLLKDEHPYLTRSTNPNLLNIQPSPLDQLMAANGNGAVPPLRLVIESGKPVVIPETLQEPSWPDQPEFKNLRSFAAAPLRVGSEVFGFLIIHDKRPGSFNDDSIQRLEAVAAHASLAVQNANLYNELRAALRKEKATRAQLVQAQKLSAMGRMVASVAHELNNPLQTIKNCIFLSQQVIDEDEEVNTYLGMALSETKRLTNLVLQLRDVYRPDDATPTEIVDLAQVVEEVSLILRQHLRQHQVRLTMMPMVGKFYVKANANQLKQVFLNICLNGIEAMQPDGGKLQIIPEYDDINEMVGVAIVDDGPGISVEDQGKLFEPFFTTKDTGTGLGLSICYDIVQKHGGQISVVSDVGRGANFTVWLPVVTAVVSRN